MYLSWVENESNPLTLIITTLWVQWLSKSFAFFACIYFATVRIITGSYHGRYCILIDSHPLLLPWCVSFWLSNMPPWYLFEKRHHITGWHQWHAFVPGSKDHCWNRTEVLTQASSLTDLTVSKNAKSSGDVFPSKIGIHLYQIKVPFQKKDANPKIPSWELTYIPTFGKGKSSTQECFFRRYVSSQEAIRKRFESVFWQRSQTFRSATWESRRFVRFLGPQVDQT